MPGGVACCLYVWFVVCVCVYACVRVCVCMSVCVCVQTIRFWLFLPEWKGEGRLLKMNFCPWVGHNCTFASTYMDVPEI
jgi:hypothetical protein